MSRYRPIEERIRDWRPVELRPSLAELAREMERCQECGIPFCHSLGCPLGNVVPEINAAALAGHWDLALAKLLATNPFPEFTARVCPALCEGACVQGLQESPVPDRLIEYEVIERGFAAGLVRPRPPRRRNLSAAVIGSGPAGLAAAWRLNQGGASVTVYERDDRPGGFLRYGIPDFKLEKEVVDRRISLLEAEGLSFECGVTAGADISERLLRRRHQILVLAVGARQKRDLSLPGRDLAGIHFATDYLAAQNRVVSGELAALPLELDARGRRVVVLGGGDTGSDCVGTARRQGAASVSQFEILPRPPSARAEYNPWPQWPRVWRSSSSHEEGCERRWSVDTLEFRPAAGRPGTLGFVRGREVRWTEDGGRLTGFEPEPGSEFEAEADLALLALGFTGLESDPLTATLGASPRRDPAGRLGPGLYLAGDAASGPSLVVRALDDGLKTALTALRDF